MRNLKHSLKNHISYDKYEKADIENFLYALETLGKELYFRHCLVANITTIIWVVNPHRTRVLLGYHNLLKTYNWFGGHADGQFDLLANSKKEYEEETGCSNYKVLNDGKPIAFSALSSQKHQKLGEIVSNHIHYCPVYAFEVSEDEEFHPNLREISEIKWCVREKISEKIIGDRDATILAKRLVNLTPALS